MTRLRMMHGPITSLVSLHQYRALQVAFPMIFSWIEARNCILQTPTTCSILGCAVECSSSIDLDHLAKFVDSFFDNDVTVKYIISALADVEEPHICTTENRAIYDYWPSKMSTAFFRSLQISLTTFTCPLFAELY